MGLVPTVCAVAFIAFLLIIKAPSQSLSWNAVVVAASSTRAGGAVAILAVAIALAITLQPLQFRLVQLLEGYWPRGPQVLFRFGVGIQRRRFQRLQRRLVGENNYPTLEAERAAEERMQVAEVRLTERFPTVERLLPTALGNALRSAEDRAGQRYGADSVTLWPRLFPLLPPEFRLAIEDEVTQLDVSARLAVTWSLTGVVALVILGSHPVRLLQHPGWVLLVAMVWLLAWLSYQAAIESAVAHGLDVEVALDLHRSLVIAAMRLPEPGRLSVERRTLSTLCELFQTYEADHRIELDYRSAVQPKATSKSSLATARTRIEASLPTRPQPRRSACSDSADCHLEVDSARGALN